MNKNDFLNFGCFIALPKLNKVWLLTNISAHEKNEDQKFAFYKNNFFLTEKKPWLKSDQHFEMSLEGFRDFLHESKSTMPQLNWNSIEIESYKKQFHSLKQKIAEKKLIKGVPFAHQLAELELKQENLVYFINSLLNYKTKDNLYLYGYWNFKEKYGFLGATPELLFTQNENNIETYALAGTINNEKIHNGIDKKITREHNLVIDGMKAELKRFGKIKTENTVLLTLDQFSHLKSVLHLKLYQNKFNFHEVLSSIHPTPALGAFPKKEGFQWLNEVEKTISPRGDYCSPFGICLDKKFSLCIGVIRCLQWDNNSLKITAGGGVIEESCFDDEWLEICMKIDSVKNYFKL